MKLTCANPVIGDGTSATATVSDRSPIGVASVSGVSATPIPDGSRQNVIAVERVFSKLDKLQLAQRWDNRICGDIADCNSENGEGEK